MPNVVEDCRHDHAQAAKWIAHKKPPEQSWYRGKKKLREVVLLERMMRSPLRMHFVDWKESRRHHEATQAERLVNSLATQWRNETAHVSSITRMVSHPAYCKIIGV